MLSPGTMPTRALSPNAAPTRRPEAVVPGAAARSSVPVPDPVAGRAAELFARRVTRLSAETDRRFAWLMLAQWLFCVVLALSVSPQTTGVGGTTATAATHPHLWTAVLLGGALAAVPAALAWLRPGAVLTRYVVALAQMSFSALLIHLTGGRVETHFHIFGSLAFLGFYRDWRVLAAASAFVLADHGVRGWLRPESLFGSSYAAGDLKPLLRAAEHGAWVTFEVVFLGIALRWSRADMRRAAADQARLEALNGQIALAKQEGDTIMAAVSEGLFLLDAGGRVGRQHSRALAAIFGRDDLAGADFLELLRPALPERTWASVRDYLGLLFDPGRNERPLARINPLAAVEIRLLATVASTPGVGIETVVSKHLEFTFRRVLGGDEGGGDGAAPRRRVTHLLVAVVDVSDRVNLERQLRRNEAAKQKEIELLFSILHVEPGLLREFMEAGTATLGELNAALRGNGDDHGAVAAATDDESALREKLAAALRSIHTFKGNAAMLRLGYFEGKAHALEEEIKTLQRRPVFSGQDLLPLVFKQAEVHRDMGELKDLLHRVLQLQISFTASPDQAHLPFGDGAVAAVAGTVPADPLLAAVADYVRELGERLNRPAAFFYDDFAGTEVPTAYAGLLRDVLLQLARNSLTHGLEAPTERAEARKPPQGRLQLLRPRRMTSPGRRFEFVFRDDGRGLQLHRLRGRAIERGDATAVEAEAWPPERLAALIFEPGLSTADGVTGEAGRGVGMDVVKTRVVDDHGGEIRVHSMPGQHTTFHVLLPG